ncbi:hypothetical protein GOV05_02485 [Candidatus Woesearchaeota archaeon]|nr:hypothetical protein [Candidatus Woesearchaeota archaeon]
MYRPTKLTQAGENLVAIHTVKSALDSYAKRADRKLKPLAAEVYDRLTKKQKIAEGSQFVADYRFDRKDKARTMGEGVKEFKQRYPEYGAKLQDIIDETRKTKQRYLQFGLSNGSALPDELYIGALRSINVPEFALEDTLETVMDLSASLATKKEEGLTEMLIK